MIFIFTFNNFHLVELEMISHEKKNFNISNEKEY